MTAAEITAVVIICALLLVFMVAGILWAGYVKQHQNRKPMRKHKVKIVVDNVSIDVALECPPKPWATLTLISGTLKVKGDIDMFSYTTDQRVIFTIEPRNEFGSPAVVESIQKSISDPSLGEIQALDEEPDNPLKFQLISPIGAQFDWAGDFNPRPFSVTVTADAKLGDGENQLTMTVNGELTYREATSLGLTPSAATNYDPHAE